uniref:Uncharacterized protein n=1 Tax=Arion vulgaris TaxID=1028688 RepID=A0A0B7AVH6_9EUPU
MSWACIQDVNRKTHIVMNRSWAEEKGSHNDTWRQTFEEQTELKPCIKLGLKYK